MGYQKSLKSFFDENKTQIMIILFAVFSIYVWTVFFGYVNYDDAVLVDQAAAFLKNPNLDYFKLGLNSQIVVEARYFRPILLIVYLIEVSLFGSRAFFPHFMNIILHLGVSFVLYILLKKNIKKETACVLTTLFAVHPALVHAVAWVPGRNDILLGLFSILCLYFFTRLLTSNQLRNILYFSLFLFLSIFTKETAVVLPILILFYYLLFDEEKNKKVVYKLIAVAIIPAIMLGFWFILRSALYSLNSDFFSIQFSIKDLPALLSYWGKSVIPFHLSYYPSIRRIDYGIGAFAIVLMTLALVFLKKNNLKRNNLKWTMYGILWFLIFLLPTFFQFGNQYFAGHVENRLYTPLIGVIFMISILEFPLIKGTKHSMLYAFIIIFWFISIGRIMPYRNALAFWTAAAKSSAEESSVHSSLGKQYLNDSQFENAESEFKKALEINKNENHMHNNLAIVYMAQGRYDEAEKELQAEFDINPDSIEALINYGFIKYMKKDFEKAEEFWMKAYEVAPQNPKIFKVLSEFYLRTKQDDKNNSLKPPSEN
ncbi:hypothetical protein COT75_03375 [Candidatus Beckwithbacteria bacterium CG10_big_fil_rev_8_21_14_0_10_34_10]|uniref:Glycosyltransferase RgtA/B/C/D-like domain-containing protein n=1 Tax=Candidatus Beckwithbacteria bacterium CG10_big_fil_rev_8_21_14_0_10_34_10 TaxID=1974495 RepID=A0A2H0WB12_9BACT|nr:MAG: hypothetical protein COT75_03375 [Candidatus Beckwithbacteria bacterium CG10_big_fil_rev_8_21_14_0_10_34_10]